MNLIPRLDLDYTLIAAKNCTQCPRKEYDAVKSEQVGYLKPTAETKNITLGDFRSKTPLEVGGSYVKDTLSTRSLESREKIFNNITEWHEFFLVHNITGEETILKRIAKAGSDGFLGLAPSMTANGKPSYVEYLKKIGAIT